MSEPFDELLLTPGEDQPVTIDVEELIHQLSGELKKKIGRRMTQEYYLREEEIRGKKKQLVKLLQELHQAKEDLVKERVPQVPPMDVMATGFTLRMFDILVDQIGWWNTQCGVPNQLFTDFSKALLWPTVYQSLVDQVDGYALTELPTGLEDVVKLGRTFMKEWSEADFPGGGIDSPPAGDHPVISWWINIGLPVVYGAQDPDWSTTPTLAMSEVRRIESDPLYREQTWGLGVDVKIFEERAAEFTRRFTKLYDLQTTLMNSRFEV